MLGKRWHLVSAFAGGCVCTTLVVLVWAAGGEAPRDATDPRESVVEPTAALEPAPSVAPTTVEPAGDAPVATVDAPAAEPSEPGRSVAEVLAQLEARYRADQRPEPVAEPVVEAPAPVAVAVPAPQVPAEAPAVAAPVPAPTTAPAPAPVAVAAPGDAVPQAPPALAVAQPVADDQEREMQERERETRERDAYIASVYQAELYRQQQLALLEYLVLISQNSAGQPGPTGQVRARPARRSPTFTFPLRDPANPWGFDLPPAVLAK